MPEGLLSISANALRSCMMSFNCNISFESIHRKCKKCTPSPIMYYQISLRLHRTLNEIFESCTSEHAALLNNIVCTGRQLQFEVIISNRSKIGMNSIKNKFYQIPKLIGLDLINLSFVHFKKMMKIQFKKWYELSKFITNTEKAKLLWSLKIGKLNCYIKNWVVVYYRLSSRLDGK